MKPNEKAAYLQGLFEGLDIDKTTPEGKLFTAMLDTVSLFAQELTTLKEKIQEVNDYVEEIDDDLALLENEFYDDTEDEEDAQDDEYDEVDFFEATCPSCGKVVCFDDSSLDPDELSCPHCGQKLEWEAGCGGDCCGGTCDCSADHSEQE
ncbi:MAG: CD1247 N-terminal domain-containing protein [Eubacteriales bacterium]